MATEPQSYLTYVEIPRRTTKNFGVADLRRFDEFTAETTVAMWGKSPNAQHSAFAIEMRQSINQRAGGSSVISQNMFSMHDKSLTLTAYCWLTLQSSIIFSIPKMHVKL